MQPRCTFIASAERSRPVDPSIAAAEAAKAPNGARSATQTRQDSSRGRADQGVGHTRRGRGFNGAMQGKMAAGGARPGRTRDAGGLICKKVEAATRGAVRQGGGRVLRREAGPMGMQDEEDRAGWQGERDVRQPKRHACERHNNTVNGHPESVSEATPGARKCPPQARRESPGPVDRIEKPGAREGRRDGTRAHRENVDWRVEGV